ncbi:hypothetical protein [Flavihumibacter fluvii]|uniref:bestrophin-like domain n=1 Tax=Flavihumibacter fluvii TaxID=2838157 RepID=UPI001BDE1ED2|nr:hypothetical protein [Flavihumibacter fluvii]ULQ51612.1 hypothetical protein KJS93_16095 [Flavihumibacter fluvii]
MILLALFQYSPWVISMILLVCMIVAVSIGLRLGNRNKERDNEDDKTTSNLIGGIFALNAFLLAFTFSMSAGRYEARRDILVLEANNIGTAILRADLYPDSMRNILMPLFREYVETRIAYYSITGDSALLNASVQKANGISGQIWQHCTAYFRQTGSMVPSNQLVPALNDMIDIVNTRQQQLYAMVPETIVMMLFVLTITSAFLAGYSNKKGRMDWPVVVCFCILTAFVIFITLDLDRPRTGLIRLDTAENSMLELRQIFK